MESTAKEAALEAELKSVRAELEATKQQFTARLAALEAVLPQVAPAEEATVSDETLAILAAAVTSFLGKKVKVRSARLVSPLSSWAQAGRVSVQASHQLR